MFGSATDIYDFGPDLADVVTAYLVARPGYTPFTDGRIIQKKANIFFKKQNTSYQNRWLVFFVWASWL